MSLLSGFNITLPELSLLGEVAMAALAGGVVPVGWNVLTPQQLGVPPQYWDGNYFTNNGASAVVLQQGSTWIVSFRGTDGPDDIARYPELVLGTYINHFAPLLNAVASNAPDGASFYFTGVSLGGGVTNLMANIAGSQYGGEFASAKFVAFCIAYYQHSKRHFQHRIRKRSGLQGIQWLSRFPFESRQSRVGQLGIYARQL